MSPAPELKATLTLPQTAFPMKANLPQNEPLRLARWAALRLYEELRKSSRGRPAYLLHDGPPYANGPIHLGHALNKGLKDFVVKSKTMAGFDAPYVPGFDCHGLPIEIKVDEKLGRKKLEMPAPAVLDACRAYAQTYIDLQTQQFERIGCFGRWDQPYKTMARSYEAKTLEAFFGFLEGGFVYRGLKPVYWCIHDRTALAEAEVEYENHTSPSIYVRYKMTSDPSVLDLTQLGQDEEVDVYAIIWTTTPWTLPASLAVAFNPDLEYTAVEATIRDVDPDPKIYVIATSLLEHVASKCNFRSPDHPDDENVGFRQLQDESGMGYLKIPGSQLATADLQTTSTFEHPFLARRIYGVRANYVTADTGTGAVHTAPAHGADDFYTGQRYGLDLTCRVDAGGRIHYDPAAWHQQAPPPYDGLTVWKANPVILDMLKTTGALLAASQFEHSYPHCWRCHHPIIFRATEQWFISLETPMQRADGSETTFRNLAIEEIDKVVWDPAWGKERITNMIATRPDWCISRQRIWGVPIAVFLCEACNEPIINADLNRRIVQLFEREGIEAWHTTAASALLWDELKMLHAAECPSGGASFRKETDILDVWFDSGVSWFAVCESDPDLRAIYESFQQSEDHSVATNSGERGEDPLGAGSRLPEGAGKIAQDNSDPERSRGGGGSPGNAEEKISSSPVGATEPPQKNRPEVFYLEGGDQHRGWFHSSLLTSVALRGRAPYSHVATAGWTLDEQGRAMSKSLGNGVDPVDIANRLGGEIVRLWVASVDFREDMAASENLMQRCAELYKKLRNTFRFLLGNLHGFEPARDAVAESELLPLDRYMLARTRELAEKIVGADGKSGWYGAFEFHRIYHAVNEFAIVDLSAFYLDVLKDRMYTFAPTSRARRSAQTVLWKITETLVRLVAPILTFTAEEVWEHLPKVDGRPASVHLALFPKAEEIFPENPAYLIDNWKLLFAVRNGVLNALEELRQTKFIGKSLEADVELYAEGAAYDNLRESGVRLEELFNVSQVRVIKDFQRARSNARVRGAQESGFAHVADVRAFVMPASGHKCARCWNFMPHVSNYGVWENVCDRCQNALREMGIDPPSSDVAEAEVRA